MQFSQIVRTSRWAEHGLERVEEIRNGSTSMSISRVIGAGGVVGVQRAEHQVAGQRGLDGDLRRLQVADFADHDDVRVLAQEGAQHRGEGQADGLVDRHLDDALDVVLDRLLGGQQLGLDRVDAAAGPEYSVVVLPEPVGPVTMMMPLGLSMSSLKVLVDVVRHAEVLELQRDDAAVQHAEHHALAELGRQGGHAEVDRAGRRS